MDLIEDCSLLKSTVYSVKPFEKDHKQIKMSPKIAFNGPNPASFCSSVVIFVLFNDAKPNTAQCEYVTINDKSVECVLGTRTRMEGADESTELWRYPELFSVK